MEKAGSKYRELHMQRSCNRKKHDTVQELNSSGVAREGRAGVRGQFKLLLKKF